MYTEEILISLGALLYSTSVILHNGNVIENYRIYDTAGIIGVIFLLSAFIVPMLR